MKALLTLGAVVLLWAAAQAQTPDEATAPLYGVVSGSATTNHDFSAWKGGLQLGIAIPLDRDKGLTFRSLYTKAEFGDESIQTIRLSLLMSWYAGKRWSFYVPIGGDAALTDSTSSGYFLGLGANRRIYTGDQTSWIVPFTVDVFADFITEDVLETGSNLNQINFGLIIGRPVKR